MSLALAHVTHSICSTAASRDADFRRAVQAVRRGEQLAPADAYGAVLSIGVHLLFLDALASMQEFPDRVSYDFGPTPLRNAAAWLLSGHHVAAHNAFDKIADSGRYLLGALGKTRDPRAFEELLAHQLALMELLGHARYPRGEPLRHGRDGQQHLREPRDPGRRHHHRRHVAVLTCYRPLQRGLRFSANARVPSCKSSERITR